MKSNTVLASVGVVVVAVVAYFFIMEYPAMFPDMRGPTVPVTSTSTTIPSGSASSSLAVGVSPIDGSWKTYTSKMGDFGFKSPSKGRYTPTWEVSFSDHDCAGDGAMKLQQTTLDVSGVAFCHTSFSEGAAGSIYYTDAYTTKQGSRFVVLTFTKRGYSAGALNCSFVADHAYSTSPSSCIPFDDAAYQSQLGLIMSTFAFATK